MTTRGVRKPDVSMVTTRFTGLFQTDSDLQARFLNQARWADPPLAAAWRLTH